MPLANTAEGIVESIDLTIFVPCYNEATRIEGTLETISEAHAELKLAYEVIIVDDGSRDDTARVVELYLRNHPGFPGHLHRNPRNLGLSRSFVEAAFQGKGRFYRLVCGDNVEPKETMISLASMMGKADIVLPYYPTLPGKSRARRLISRTFTFLVNTLGGHSIKYSTGCAVYRRFHVMRWAPYNYGFGFQCRPDHDAAGGGRRIRRDPGDRLSFRQDPRLVAPELPELRLNRAHAFRDPAQAHPPGPFSKKMTPQQGETSGASASETAEAVARLLACPVGHGRLTVAGDVITSAEPAFRGQILDGVAMMTGSIQKSFFDDKYETMRLGHQKEGEWAFCYAQQTALLTSYLLAGQVVLDVGCGPSLPYSVPPGVTVVGLEPSFNSIRVNRDVSLRVNGIAAAIPMADASVDAVVCFYSIHHMVGGTIEATRANVAAAFREFARVLKPGGSLFIFEMTPIGPFYAAQAVLWNAARRMAPRILDMYFWSADALARVARENLPEGAAPEKLFFGTSAFTAIPPVFNLPWFKIPRLFYPLDAKLYRWRMVPAAGGPREAPAR